MNRPAIGGYFEMQLGTPGPELYPDALHFQSARACLQALLRTGRPRRIWMPWYICETMVDQARLVGVDIARYSLEEDFSVQSDLEIEARDWILYVNYFGLCDERVEGLFDRFASAQILIDNAHALYSPPRGGLATIYSPRKFAGLPDGGCMVTSLDVPEPAAQDAASPWRCVPLLIRAAQDPESGYAEYLRSEESLAAQAPLRMSTLTRALLKTIDFRDAAARRLANFASLDRALGSKSPAILELKGDAVPLAYPYMRGSSALRKFLVSRRVYAQHFWPHLLDPEPGVPEFERFLAETCIPLPCDQRYGDADMTVLAALIDEHGS